MSIQLSNKRRGMRENWNSKRFIIIFKLKLYCDVKCGSDYKNKKAFKHILFISYETLSYI